MNPHGFQLLRSRFLSRQKIVFAGLTIVVVIAAVLTVVFLMRAHNKRDSIKEFNLIVICVDTLRADHLGCYGYHRKTSPRIDSLAENGILFENAYSNSSFTRESVSTILSGLLPSVSGSVGWFACPNSGVKGMGEIFKAAGYQTAFFSATNTLRFKPFTRGFQHVEHYSESKVSGNSPILSGMARDFIAKNKDQKFMMYLHYLDPHGPYEPPEEFFSRFTKSFYPNPIAQYTYIRMHCAELIKEGFGPGEARFENILLRYDAEIAHTDYAIGMVLDTLKEWDILDNTVIVITADHGEEFLEHRFVEHGYTLYKETTHIPLIFWGKPVTQPHRVKQRVSSVDILPTVLSLLKVPSDRRDFDGLPLFSINNNVISFFPSTQPYVAELLVQHRNMLRAVVKDNWKYTASLKWTLPEARPDLVRMDIDAFERDTKRHLDIWGPIVCEELYDLSNDPGERFNIIASNSGKRDELRKILDRYEYRCKAKHAGKIRKVWNEGPLSPEDKKKLKSLGYL